MATATIFFRFWPADLHLQDAARERRRLHDHGRSQLSEEHPARRDLYEVAEHAEQRLGLQVNPVLCSRARWIAAADPLIQIRSAPVFWVTGCGGS